MKLLIKLAIAALVINGAWRLGSAYASYYWFQDAVAQTTQFGHGRSDDDLRQAILELASQYQVPLAENAFSIRRDDRNHIIVEGSYVQPVEVAPRYRYPWTFTFHTDTFTVRPITPSDIPQ